LEVFFLSALLPPRDDGEAGFYEILGVQSNATDAEMKKAYKKLSLRLHPDKIAQRGGDVTEQEEAAAEYEKIQEAYGVLIDEKKRLKYDALETPMRYRFVEKGAFTNPQSVYENLTSSSMNDKSRLVGLYFFAILLVLLQPILVAAKVNQALSSEGLLANSSWFAILVPYWIFGGLLIAMTFVAAVFVPAIDRIPICLSGLEQICWYIGIIFLSLKWDRTWDDSVPYRQALAPVFVAMILRWFRSLVMLRKIRKDVNRMVTSDYIENEVLKGRSMDELSEEEQADLKEAFVVVRMDPEFQPIDPDLSAEELEEEKVATSPEFRNAMDIYLETFNGLGRSVLFGGIFLILLTLKLDNRLGDAANWWAVFSPVFIERGSRLVTNFYKCLCGGIVGEEIVMHIPQETGDENDGDDKDSTGNKGEKGTPGSEDVTASGNANTDDESPATTNHQPNILSEVDTEEKKPGNESLAMTNQQPNEDKSDYSSNGKNQEAETTVDEVSKMEQKAKVEDGSANDEEEFFIDEDAYRHFESAYEQAESDSKQERATSCSNACIVIVQIILLCLVVAKIEYSHENLDPSDSGFSVFWILFPFFLVFGCSLCCCAMLIFGAEPDPSGEETDEVVYDPENPPETNENENGGNVTIMSPSPGKEEESAVEVTTEASENSTQPAVVDQIDSVGPPPEGSMDDLD